MLNISTILAELVKLAPLLDKAIPALAEGAQLLGTAVPGAGVQSLLTEGENLIGKLGPLGQAIEQFIQAIEAHKAAASPPAAQG